MLQPGDIRTCDLREGTLVLVDKPQGWTSFDVVNKVRWAIRRTLGVKKFKVGHSGTLDPMATGLLLLCVGKWTKKLGELQGLDKTYIGTLTLGGVTPSYDADTEISNVRPYSGITLEAVERTIKSLTGNIMQRPPAYSAIKVDGKPLYKSARKGREVIVDARPVTVHKFVVTRFELPEVDFEVSCSKGTYIRSLAHDLGQELGCGAYLTGLRRTSVGEYRIEDAWEVDSLVTAIQERGDKPDEGV